MFGLRRLPASSWRKFIKEEHLRRASSKPLDAFLRDGKGVIVLDGAMGTALGVGVAQKHIMWGAQALLSPEGQDDVRKVHTSFLEAGANIIGTNSYKVSYEMFDVTGVFSGEFPQMAPFIEGEKRREQFAHDILVRSVELARECRDVFGTRLAKNQQQQHLPLVAAAVGPYGDNALAFVGATDPNSRRHAGNLDSDSPVKIDKYYRRKLEALCSAMPDLVALETIPSRLEAEVAVSCLEKVAPAMPAWVTFICDSKTTIASGEPWSDAVLAVAGHPSVCAVGLNCTAPNLVGPLLRSATAALDEAGIATPLVAYPNSGEVWDSRKDHRCWIDGGAMKVLDGADALDMYANGARLIGGCCNVSANQIAMFQQSLSRYQTH